MTIEFENGNPPEWMIALENKQKRHHRLAHDIGAGAPCLNCNDGCVGLDLHFWRKICRNCKCKKEVHDVKEENSNEQFEILFGDNISRSDRVKQLSVELKLDDILNSREAHLKESMSLKSDDNLAFDWIPVDVPANLASEYLQQLPLEKLPITGSAGAMFRRQQLQKQMPLHDFKINNCHDLTDEETKAFADYVDNLKSNAVGKGHITKVFEEDESGNSVSAHHEARLPIFSNNLNSTPKPFKPSYDGSTHLVSDSFPPPPTDLLYPEGLSLKTPSAFTPYSKPSKRILSSDVTNADAETTTAYESINPEQQLEISLPLDKIISECAQMGVGDKQPTLNEIGSTTSKTNPIQTHEKNVQFGKTIPNTETNILDTKNNNWYHNNDADGNTEVLKPSDIIRKFNSLPKSTAAKEVLKDNLMNRNISPSNSTAANEVLKDNLMNRNISPLNDVASKNVDGKFLKLGTPVQLQALSSYVHGTPQVSNTLINPELKQIHSNDSKNIQKMSFDPPAIYTDQAIHPYQQMKVENQNLLKCHQCKISVYPGQVVILAERAGIEVVWHPQCFVCVSCQELLVDLVYFFHKGEVYCGRDYAEELKIPRCFACDELIFLKEYTVAEGQSFHIKHFCCFECDIPLAGMQYVPKDNNPVCLSCYEMKYGKKCHCCNVLIRAGESRVGWKELSWHATPDCFKCVQCFKSLLGGKFVVKENRPLCSKECMMKL